MSNTSLKMRRVLVQLPVGGTVVMNSEDRDQAEFIRDIRSFCRAKKIFVNVRPSKDGVEVTRLATKPVDNYAELDRLEVGESILLEHPPETHGLIRIAASLRGRGGQVKFRCRREGDALRVIRLPVGGPPDELAKLYASVPGLRSKYGLERLATERAIVVDVDIADRGKVRSSATIFAQRFGWTLSCNVEGKSQMRITRKDQSAPGEGEPLPVVERAKRSSKYALERLEHQDSILFDMPRSDHLKLRAAALQFGQRQKWTIRCNAQGDTMRVTRVHPSSPPQVP